MPSTTSGSRAVPYAVGTDLANTLDATSQAQAEFIRDDIQVGIASARPAFGAKGRRYYATDTGDLSLDTGDAWVTLLSTARAEVSSGSDSSTWVALGAPTGHSMFTRAAIAATTNARLNATPGLYRITLTGVTSTTTKHVTVSVVNSGGTPIFTVSMSVAGSQTHTTSGIGRLAAGDGFAVSHGGGSGTVTLVSLFAERLGP